jgi:hypothetical protein
MPVGPTDGPIGGPPDALPPVTRAFTITFPFSLKRSQLSLYSLVLSYFQKTKEHKNKV